MAKNQEAPMLQIPRNLRNYKIPEPGVGSPPLVADMVQLGLRKGFELKIDIKMMNDKP